MRLRLIQFTSLCVAFALFPDALCRAVESRLEEVKLGPGWVGQHIPASKVAADLNKMAESGGLGPVVVSFTDNAIVLSSEHPMFSDSKIEILNGPTTAPITMASAPVSSGALGVAFVSMTAFLQAAIFAAACYLIYRLWQVVLNAWGGATDRKSKMLLALLGGLDTAVDGGAASGKAKGRLKGAGLIGTIAILAFACVAIYIIGGNKILPDSAQTEHASSGNK